MARANKWSTIDKQLRRKCADEIITRVLELDGEEPGMIMAEEIIEIVIENLGPDIYNQALKDAGTVVDSKLSDLQTELEILKQDLPQID